MLNFITTFWHLWILFSPNFGLFHTIKSNVISLKFPAVRLIHIKYLIQDEMMSEIDTEKITRNHFIGLDLGLDRNHISHLGKPQNK